MTYTERINSFKENWEATGSVYQAGLLIPEVVNDEYFESLKPKQEFYECRKYERRTTLSPTKVEEKLSSLVKEKVPKSPFFSYFKRKNEFIESHKDSVTKELEEELKKEEDKNEVEFISQEKNTEKEKNEQFEQIYKFEMEEYENIFNPNQEWLEEKFEEYKNKIVKKWGGHFLAVGSSVKVDKTVDGSNKYSISIAASNLTEFSEQHPYKYSITAAGNLSQRVKTDKQIEEEYAQNVCAVAFIQAVCLFNVCLDAKDVLVTCWINHVDSSTGNEEDRYLYSVIVPRELVKSFKMENLNTVAALMSLEGRADIRKEREIYFIDPIEWNLEVSNSKKEDEVSEINIDFRRLNINLSLPESFKQTADFLLPKIENLKETCKNKVLEFEMFTDEFDADNYSGGLTNLILALILLKQDETLFESQNYQRLNDELAVFFGNNSYAMGEIQKLIDNDIIPLVKREDAIPELNSFVYAMLSFVFNTALDE